MAAEDPTDLAYVEKRSLYDDLVAEWLAVPGVEEGTMMGFPCLRIHGDFFASLDRRSGDLVIKLPSERVTRLVADGSAESFAPNGRVFKEWAAITTPNEDTWRGFLDEAQRFVADTQGPER